ncbi:MAG: PLP-dependent aminotransferase family protein, partial [Sciscionella sp.]
AGAAGSRGLAEAIRGAINSGRLAKGDALPSTRSLAGDLGIARGTVSTAYAQLVAEGYLATAQGAPTRVAASLARTADPPPPSSNEVGTRWNLLPGRPDLSAFPRAQWLSATRKVLTEMPAAAFGYGDPRGELALRTALAHYLGRSRGVHADPDRIVVCSGHSQAMSLLGKLLRDRGDQVMAFEDPSLWVFRDIAVAAGQRIVGVPVDDDGIRVSEIDSPAVVVTPAHQYPLGVTLAPHRRVELVAWAERTGAVVIEDDYDGEFRFDRQPVGAVQALAPERVVYSGTASKTLAPALRLSWLVLPRVLVEPVGQLMSAGGWRGQTLGQLVLAELITSGAYDRHVRRLRTSYRRRRDQLLEVLPDPLRTRGIAAGLHLVAELPGGVLGEAEVLAAARRHSVSIETLGPHWMEQAEDHPQGLVIGYAAPAEHAFGPAVDALACCLREC